MLLMSTTSSGEAKRSFISGTRLWPPASTLASSPPWCSRLIASSSDRGASYRNRDGYIRSSRCPSGAGSGFRVGLRRFPPGRGPRFRVGYRHGQRVLLGIRPGLLVRRPRSRHRLARDLEVVDQFGPGPDGRALPGLRGVLDQFVEPRVPAAVPVGFDSHAHAPAAGQAPFLLVTRHHDPLGLTALQRPNKCLLMTWPRPPNLASTGW